MSEPVLGVSDSVSVVVKVRLGLRKEKDRVRGYLHGRAYEGVFKYTYSRQGHNFAMVDTESDGPFGLPLESLELLLKEAEARIVGIP